MCFGNDELTFREGAGVYPYEMSGNIGYRKTVYFVKVITVIKEAFNISTVILAI